MTSKPLSRSQLLSLAFILLLTGSIVTTACASRSAPPRLPGAAPLPTAPSGSNPGAQLASTALQLQGAPYRNGGADSSGFDCSGFVQYVFAQYGVALPRSVKDQFEAGLAVSRTSLVPGDLVFFATTARTASHVGIVVGDDAFVHAPSGHGTVRVERLSAEYWTRRYLGARRILIP